MINSEDYTDLVLLDWEWSGFSNPAIDLAVWFFNYPRNWLMPNEDNWLLAYYKGLLSENPDLLHSYMFEDLKKDYLFYGTAHILVRNIGLAGYIAEGGDTKTANSILGAMANWVNEHNF